MKKSNSRTTPPQWNVHQVTTSSADALVHSSALAALTTPTSKEQCYLRIRHVCQPSKKLWKAKMFHCSISGLQSWNPISVSPRLQLNRFPPLCRYTCTGYFLQLCSFFLSPKFISQFSLLSGNYEHSKEFKCKNTQSSVVYNTKLMDPRTDNRKNPLSSLHAASFQSAGPVVLYMSCIM